MLTAATQDGVDLVKEDILSQDTCKHVSQCILYGRQNVTQSQHKLTIQTQTKHLQNILYMYSNTHRIVCWFDGLASTNKFGEK